MKLFFPILLLFFSLSSLAQQGKITGKLLVTQEEFKPGGTFIRLTVKNNTIMETMADNSGRFMLKNIPEGTYKLRIRQAGFNEEVSTVNIVKDTVLQLTVKYPPECIYYHPKKYKPVCIGGHTDSIIPIVYGYPLPKTVKSAEEGKIILGGCEVTYCDPKYYCTRHKRSF